jgi:small GTP-binding protein
MDSSNDRNVVKITLVGACGVGKSCLINRYKYGTFEPINSTIASAFFSINTKIDGKNIKTQVWDTAGMEKYSTLIPLYLRHSDVVLLCFDRPNIGNIDGRIKKIRETTESAEIFLVRTKVDMAFSFNTEETRNTLDELKEFSESVKCKLYHTSSKEGCKINELFNDAIKIGFGLKNKDPPPSESIIIEPNKNDFKNNQYNSVCCSIL